MYIEYQGAMGRGRTSFSVPIRLALRFINSASYAHSCLGKERDNMAITWSNKRRYRIIFPHSYAHMGVLHSCPGSDPILLREGDKWHS